MRKGRPVYSEIRQNIIEILSVMGKAYGYQICKVYKQIFPNVTMRSIYYNLKKGLSVGEFEIEKILKERGEYSWGGEAEKIYYKLGGSANPKGSDKVREHFLESTELKESVAR